MVMLYRDALRADFGLETKDFILVAYVPGITSRTHGSSKDCRGGLFITVRCVTQLYFSACAIIVHALMSVPCAATAGVTQRAANEEPKNRDVVKVDTTPQRGPSRKGKTDLGMPS